MKALELSQRDKCMYQMQLDGLHAEQAVCRDLANSLGFQSVFAANDTRRARQRLADLKTQLQLAESRHLAAEVELENLKVRTPNCKFVKD